MPCDTDSTADRPVAILDPDELADYQKLVKVLADQRTLVQRARAALEQAEFIERRVQTESARTWREVCEAHGLDASTLGWIATAGRFFSAILRRAFQRTRR